MARVSAETFQLDTGPCLIRQMHTYAVFQFTECVHLRRLKPAPESVQSSSSWKCVKGDGDQVESTYTYVHRDIPHRHAHLTDTDINTSYSHTSQTYTSYTYKHLSDTHTLQR